MSKENIIGIILLLLLMLFMLSPYYQNLVGIKSQPQKTSLPQLDSLSIDKERTITGSPQKSTILPDTAKRIEKLVYVRNNLYEAILSSMGGDLKRFNLLLYKDFKGNPVELISINNNTPAFRIELKLDQGELMLDSIYLNPDKDTIVLSSGDSTVALTFTGTTSNGISILRRYEFHYKSYLIHHQIFVSGEENNLVREAKLSLLSGIRPTERNPKLEIKYIRGVLLYGDELIRKSLGNKPLDEKFDGLTSYCGVISKYFAILLAEGENPADGSYISANWDSAFIFGEKLAYPHFNVGLISTVSKNYFKDNNILYLGPQDYFGLRKLKLRFEKVVDLGWKILRPLAVAFLFIFVKIHDIFPNYGIVIIIFSLIIKILLHPLNLKMLNSMRKMKELEPKIKAIQQQYKKDPQRMNAEIMRLYREHGVNPFSGCLPMLLQMPVFFALYQVLAYTIELRASPFVLWIKDLSQKDPYLVLPLLMSITQFVQQKMSTKDPKQMGMVYIMPIVFFFIFMSFPAGLVLYWTTFNILSIITQYLYEQKQIPKGAKDV